MGTALGFGVTPWVLGAIADVYSFPGRHRRFGGDHGALQSGCSEARSALRAGAVYAKGVACEIPNRLMGFLPPK